jgi:EmrB/QacA subfamily drug resistance transporter
MLIAARFIQGAGGAMTSAVILGVIVTMFPDPREQAKAIGVYSFVASAGGSVGLLLGGVLTQGINWHWIFFVNLPIGVATAVLALRYVARDRGIGIRAGADLPGAALITAGLMLLVYTIVEPAAKHGWGSAETLGLGAAALALLAGFLVREWTARNPIMPLGIFRSRNVSGANAVQALMVAGMFGMFFLGALYLRRVLGYDALEIGLAYLPVTIAIGTLSLGYAEKLITRFGARATLIPGLVLIAAGLALFSRAPIHASYLADVLPAMLLMGIGAGLTFPALMTLAMGGVEPSEAGLASGLVNTTLQVGGALGLAVLATMSTTHTKHLLSAGHSTASALTGGYRLAFLIGVGFALAAVAVAATVLQRVGAPEATAPDLEPAYSETA